MRRLCILVFYDSQGIVDGYLDYYIQSLMQVVTELAIVVNGAVSDSGLETFRKYTKSIYIRQNEGYDAGAYQYFFSSCIRMDELENYEEVIFTNDTCFGPFVSFREIFHKMGKSKADFWGMNYIHRKRMPYLQSNFLVFRKKTVKDAAWYLKNKIPNHMRDIMDAVEAFEIGLFRYLTGLNYSFDSYAAKGDINISRSPDYAIIENGYPFIKKKVFDQSRCTGNKDNCMRALKYVQESCSYDIQLIMDCVERKYHAVFDLQEEWKRELITERHGMQNPVFDDITFTRFLDSVDSVYIYGAGAWARFLFRCYREQLEKMKGFIVSDDYYQSGSLYGYELVRFSKVKDLDAGILVGLGEKNTEDVRQGLEKYRNVLYLWQ